MNFVSNNFEIFDLKIFNSNFDQNFLPKFLTKTSSQISNLPHQLSISHFGDKNLHILMSNSFEKFDLKILIQIFNSNFDQNS